MSDIPQGIDNGTIAETSFRKQIETPERLQGIGISLRPIDGDDISMVNDRDFQGGYPYVGLLSSKYRESMDRLGIYINEQLVGYSVAGIFEQDGKKVGEVGMTHISPPMRDFGLGSVMGLVMRERLMEKDPDVLYAEVGDSTGKVQHLLEELGYEHRGKSSGAGQHPVWIREFTDVTDRKICTDKIRGALDERLPKIEQKQETMERKAEEVDKDNPYKVDVEQTVATRLATLDMFSPDNSVNFFGYTGGKLRLARSIRNGDHGYSIMLDVMDGDAETARRLLQDAGVEGRYRITPKHSFEKRRDVGIRITDNLTFDGATLTQDVQTLAKIGKQLV